MTRKTAAWLIACAVLIIGLAVIMIAALAKDRKRRPELILDHKPCSVR